MYFQFKSVEPTSKKWCLTNVYMLPILVWADHSQVHSVDSLACLHPSSSLLLCACCQAVVSATTEITLRLWSQIH